MNRIVIPRSVAPLFFACALLTTMLCACGDSGFGEFNYDPSNSCRLIEREARIVVDVALQGVVGDVAIEVYEDSTVSCGTLGAQVATPGDFVERFTLEGDSFERRYPTQFRRPVVGEGEEDAEPDVSTKAFVIIAFEDLNSNGVCDGREAAGLTTVTPAATGSVTLDLICPIGRL